MKRIWMLVLIALVCVVGAVPARVFAERTSDFQPAECMFELPAGVVEGRDIECGYVQVPELHNAPDGPKIKLAVAIIKSKSPNPAPDPLVMLQGGPGGSTIDTYTQILFPSSPLRANRDIVLFDQRGTFYSEPSLVCTELFDLTEQTLEQRLSPTESDVLSLEATMKCRARLVREGVNLAAYNSLENAADVEALRIALGYSKINLYGVSYGTLLALHVMRDHPQGLRSVILDAVVPTQINFLQEVPRSIDRSFGEFFRACAADTACNTAYPNLEQIFFDTVAELDKNPARIELVDRETGKSYNAVFDGAALMDTLFQFLYASEIIPALPKVIYDAHAGDFSFIARVLPLIVFDRTMSNGMYDSVICAEDADYRPEDVQIAGVRPQIAKDAERDARSLLELCRKWDVPALGPQVDAPVVSDIPTLVLSGRFDPITPPDFGAAAAQTLSRSYAFTFPTTAHGAATAGPCPTKIVLAFLDRPDQQPDAGCIQESSGPEFITPTSVVMTKAAPQILNMEGATLAWLGALLVGLLGLLAPLFIWPLVFLIRRVSRQATPQRAPLVRTVRWLTVLTGLLAVVFTGVLVGIVVQSALNNQLALLFGFPAVARPLFVLPPLIVLLVLGMVAGSVAIWRAEEGSLAGKIFYTLVMLAGFGFSVALAQLDLLRVLL